MCLRLLPGGLVQATMWYGVPPVLGGMLARVRAAARGVLPSVRAPRHFVVPTWVGRGSDRVVLGGGRDLLGPNSTLNPFPLALPKLPRSGDSLQPGLRIGEVWFSLFVN